ncbi:MAG: RlmE family RNA methyltransferase [Deltaproteobacteria bacterium]|nr:RlmE family RNA methyltransferase [Deltaproteobacteria bacterium]
MAKTRLDDRSTRHDRFHQKAKREGFAARAVYKLEEIDDKIDVFSTGHRVLDLGCAPGSWLQYARKQIGETAVLVGLDRPSGIDMMKKFTGVRLLTGDVMTISMDELRGDVPAFDVVLSDMAPDTTGIRSLDQARSETLFERALEIARALLAPGGNFVGKLFQGPEFKKLTDDVRSSFTKMKTVKPASSRQISIEQYVVGLHYRSEK